MAVGPRPPEVEKEKENLIVRMNHVLPSSPSCHRLVVLVASLFMYCTLIMYLAPQVEAVQHCSYGIPIGDNLDISKQISSFYTQYNGMTPLIRMYMYMYVTIIFLPLYHSLQMHGGCHVQSYEESDME